MNGMTGGRDGRLSLTSDNLPTQPRNSDTEGLAQPTDWNVKQP